MFDVFDRVAHSLGGIMDPWGYLIVFAMAMSEAALLLGTVVPGETVMLVAGYLAWKGDANIAVLIVAAIIGAIVGDSLGYEIGRHLGPTIRNSKLGRRLGDQRWERAERYMREKGGKAVFGARFVTGPKSIVPVLAGESHMRYRSFLAWNAAGAAIWGTFHVGIGYVLGPSVRAVDQWIGRAGWAVVAIVALVALGAFLWRRHSRERGHAAQRSRSR